MFLLAQNSTPPIRKRQEGIWSDVPRGTVGYAIYLFLQTQVIQTQILFFFLAHLNNICLGLVFIPA